MGIWAEARADGFEVRPGRPVFARIDARGDHRVAMAFSILGALANGVALDAEPMAASYPGFLRDLARVCPDVRVEQGKGRRR